MATRRSGSTSTSSRDRAEFVRDIAFRDALRADPELVAAYAELKTRIVKGGVTEGNPVHLPKSRRGSPTSSTASGSSAVPIAPPATIGLLGGGQLGRMLALAARAMGYRIVVLDPDPACPAASLADRLIIGGYDDVGAALRLAELSDVVTYELEHVALGRRRRDRCGSCRSGPAASRCRHPGPPRRAAFVESAGAAVAPWREVRDDRGPPCRPPRRSACRCGSRPRRAATTVGASSASRRRTRSTARWTRSAGRPASRSSPRRSSTSRPSCRSSSPAGLDGRIATFPVARNVHDDGILAECVAPAPVAAESPSARRPLGERLASRWA